MKSRPILVTGGAGFIGSHLTDRLIAAGHHVICIDNFVTGSRRNVAHLLEHPAFELRQDDVTLPIDIGPDAGIGAIYNLACPASPIHYQRDPVQTIRTNILGAMNLLDLARRRGVPILQASTSEIYGDPLQHPQPESYWGNVNPIGPRSCYDEGKRCAETLFFDYRRQYGVGIKVARIFNTYGPRIQRGDGRVVSNFIVQALLGQDIVVYGDGEQTRSFCYVDDLVDGLIRLMETPDHVIGPVNLGNPAEMSVHRLAEVIIDLTGTKSRIVHRPLPQDDPRQRQPDISQARDVLDWHPRTDLVDGLRQTIAYFEATLVNA